jgi:imidazolonepropionase-like amidohydrolase
MIMAALMAPQVSGTELAITNASVYPRPGAAKIEAATIIIRNGRIEDVGSGLDTGDLPVLDAAGAAVTAGLWNSHVHLTDPALGDDAATILRDMLLRYGFTSVVDTGSELRDTRRLAAAIEAGRLPGPRIITASGSLVYTDGTPSYLPGIRLPEVATAAEGAAAVKRFLDAGADGIKIFSGSFQAAADTVLLPPDVMPSPPPPTLATAS